MVFQRQTPKIDFKRYAEAAWDFVNGRHRYIGQWYIVCCISKDVAFLCPLSLLFGLHGLLQLLLFLLSLTLDCLSSFECDRDEGEDNVDSTDTEQSTNIDAH